MKRALALLGGLVVALIGVLFLQLIRMVYHAPATESAAKSFTLSQGQASAFAKLALKGIQREYPNKPDHVLNNAADAKNPRSLHPAFYGCFDWHSSVHGHWLLAR